MVGVMEDVIDKSISSNGNSITPQAMGPAEVDVPKEALPNGNYILVGVDIDTTGRRLIDEIVQLAVYTPDDHFEQYIMPYMNLNPAARQRHQVRVISIGFYRMLKSMQTYKIIKSKSEIAALKDFLDWLEALKAKRANTDGIILVYHEERKFIPYMILESLKKYSLLDRFANTVKSFVNGLNLAKINVNESLKHFSLRKLSKYLSKVAEDNNNNSNSINNNSIDKAATQKNKNISSGGVGAYPFDSEQFDGNASVRAKLAYKVALQLSNLNNKAALETIEGQTNMYNAIAKFAIPIICDLEELQTQNANLERQNSFRPVFINYFKTTLYHRVRAVKFRIVLAEHGFDLQSLNAIWNEKRTAGILDVLQSIQTLKDDDRAELVELLDSYFDPSKTTIKPVIKVNNNRRRNRRVRNNKNDGSGSSRSVNTEYGAGGDKSQSVSSVPDSTTKSPSPIKNAANGGGRGSRRRGGRVNASHIKSQAPPNGSNETNGAEPQLIVNTPTAVPAQTVTSASVPIMAST